MTGCRQDTAPDRDCSPAPSRWIDGFAICASSLCVIHCVGLPILIALLPIIAARIDPGETFHIAMLAIAVPTSLFALAQGWRRSGSAGLLMMGAAGLAAMAAGALWAESDGAEAMWTVAGSLVLASAHWLNWRRKT